MAGSPERASSSTIGSSQRAVAMMNPSTPCARIEATWVYSTAGSLLVSVSTSVKPAWLRICSAPRTIGGKSGLVMSGMTRAAI